MPFTKNFQRLILFKDLFYFLDIRFPISEVFVNWLPITSHFPLLSFYDLKDRNPGQCLAHYFGRLHCSAHSKKRKSSKNLQYYGIRIFRFYDLYWIMWLVAGGRYNVRKVCLRPHLKNKCKCFERSSLIRYVYSLHLQGVIKSAVIAFMSRSDKDYECDMKTRLYIANICLNWTSPSWALWHFFYS